MKNTVVWLPCAGEADVLQLIEQEMPQPATGQVRIRVEASGVIYADTLARQGMGHPGSPKIPHVPGCEVVGIVDAVGEGVSSIRIGEHVAVTALTSDHKPIFPVLSSPS